MVPLAEISCKLLSWRSTKVKAPSLVTILSWQTLVILFARGGFTLAAVDNCHHCSPSLGNGVDFTLFSLALIMVARVQGTGLRALWFITVCSVLLFASAVSGNRGSHHHHALPARRHAQPGLGHHWKRQANSTLLHGNSTLTEAELIVKAAQEEAAKRNKYIVEHVRRNRYSFGDSPGAPSSSTADSPATGINQTVAAAAAIVAESIAASDNTTFLAKRQTSSYWMANMVQNGISPFAPAGYQVWRNVRDYGAVGDGSTDDTAAINAAITDGNRCGLECGSSSTLYAVVYFPPGTYLVSSSIVQYYFTQFIGDVCLSVP